MEKKYERYYIGCAKDESIRSISSGGGVVTSILLHLLKDDIVDGVVVVRMKGLVPEQFIATTEKEIITSSQSKYMDFPIAEIVRKMKSFKGRLAIVGIPCQLRVLKSMPQIRKKVKFWLGLYCGCGLKKEATSALLKRLHIDEKDVKKIEYRAGKAYGGFQVTLNNGSSKFVSKDAYNYLHGIYMPEKCLYCKDFFNEYGDISFGDCWFKKKYTSIYARNRKSDNLLKSLDNIHLEEVSKDRFFSQHEHSVKLKKKRLDLRKYKWLFERIPLKLLSLMAKAAKLAKKYL